MKHRAAFCLPSILIGILLMLAMSNELQVQAQPDPLLPDATRSDPASVGIAGPLESFGPLAPSTRTLRIVSWDSTARARRYDPHRYQRGPEYHARLCCPDGPRQFRP